MGLWRGLGGGGSTVILCIVTSPELVPFQLLTSQHVELLRFLPICHRVGSVLTWFVLSVRFGAKLIFIFILFYFILLGGGGAFIYFETNSFLLKICTVRFLACKMEEGGKQMREGERIVARLSLHSPPRPIFVVAYRRTPLPTGGSGLIAMKVRWVCVCV